MTAEILAGAASALLSLLFGYAPKLKPWYEALDGAYKRLLMGGLILAVAVAAFALSCYYPTLLPDGWVVQCTEASATQLIKLVGVALFANVSTFTLAVRPAQA